MSGSNAERLVLYEQLRLPLRAMRWAIFPGLVLLVVMVWAMRTPCDRFAIEAWCAVAAATWLGGALHAVSRLKRKLDPAAARRLTMELRLLYAFEGAVWGGLPWVTLNSCSFTESALAMVIIAGVIASRMMLLSSVPSVFLIYILTAVAAWVAGTLFFDGLPSYALSVVGVLYVATLIFQARVHSRTLGISIRLRFENQELLEKLNRQMQIAETARIEAEEANHAKSQFLAAASHDLRQPAQAQGLFLDVLARTDLDDHQRKLLDNVIAATHASADMLNTLLDFSRIEAGVIEPRMQDFKLQTILNRIEGEFGPQADAKDLVYRTIESDLVIHSDPALVELILRNLVSNAIRYTERGGLLVACRRRGGRASLEVWDTGIGIAPQHRKDVFREFLQLGNPERDRHKGLGLGLAIVDGLARRLGCEVTLSSRPGRGTVFRLGLTLGIAAPTAAPAPPVAGIRACNARVLVIDDDDAVRSGMHSLLTDWGCQCDVAASIDEALELARRCVPSLVISDYRLRGQQTGADAIAALRAMLGEFLPALLITGDTGPDRLSEAHASGIPLLHKPVQPDALRRQLGALMAGAEG